MSILKKTKIKNLYLYIYIYIERERERERETHLWLKKCVTLILNIIWTHIWV